MTPGRSCPLRYRYGAAAIAAAPERPAQALYVVGGLYGNRPALDVVETMARAEPSTLCFNGDFHWFDVAPAAFEDVSRRVLAHDAIQGNVEAELDSPDDDAGCGCAYPDTVDAGTVERSNEIHRRLKATAGPQADWRARIAALPMVARYRVGDCRVGVVHGDAESLAGWRFDVEALSDPSSAAWLREAFAQADVDVFASTHTCLPALRSFATGERGRGWVVNNGAAGMPNFRGELAGLCTRVATTPSPHPVVHEAQAGDTWIALLPVRYDTARWEQEFLAQWPAGTPAHASYFRRISEGPAFEPTGVTG